MLIVTDEPDTMLLLRRDLEASGHHAVMAADADTAMARLASVVVEVVVLDTMMPVRDGWTVLEAVRARPEPLPVIIVSSRAGPRDLARARRMGAFGSLVTPVSAPRLNDEVARALVVTTT